MVVAIGAFVFLMFSFAKLETKPVDDHMQKMREAKAKKKAEAELTNVDNAEVIEDIKD